MIILASFNSPLWLILAYLTQTRELSGQEAQIFCGWRFLFGSSHTT